MLCPLYSCGTLFIVHRLQQLDQNTSTLKLDPKHIPIRVGAFQSYQLLSSQIWLSRGQSFWVTTTSLCDQPCFATSLHTFGQIEDDFPGPFGSLVATMPFGTPKMPLLDPLAPCMRPRPSASGWWPRLLPAHKWSPRKMMFPMHVKG